MGPRTRDRATVPTSGSGMVTHEDTSRLLHSSYTACPGFTFLTLGFLLYKLGFILTSLTKVSGQARGQGMLSVWC